MFTGVNMMETIYKKPEYKVTRTRLQKDAQKILDEHKGDANAEMVESLKNIVNTMNKTFNGLGVFQYPETGYKDIKSSIFTAIGTAVSLEANEVQKELKSLKDELDNLMENDRRFVDYRDKKRDKKPEIEKLTDDEKIKLLAEIYKKDPKQLEIAVQTALNRDNIDTWSPLLKTLLRKE